MITLQCTYIKNTGSGSEPVMLSSDQLSLEQKNVRYSIGIISNSEDRNPNVTLETGFTIALCRFGNH